MDIARRAELMLAYRNLSQIQKETGCLDIRTASAKHE
jgi:hypothetical protein